MGPVGGGGAVEEGKGRTERIASSSWVLSGAKKSRVDRFRSDDKRRDLLSSRGPFTRVDAFLTLASRHNRTVVRADRETRPAAAST